MDVFKFGVIFENITESTKITKFAERSAKSQFLKILQIFSNFSKFQMRYKMNNKASLEPAFSPIKRA